MASDIEFEIHSLLLNESSEKVANHLLLDIHNSKYENADQLTILYFALSAGHYKEVFTLLSVWPKDSFPWSIFLEALFGLNLKPKKEILVHILRAAKYQGCLENLAVNRKTEDWSKFFINLRKKFLKSVKKKYEIRVAKLREKEAFFKQEDLIEQEALIIDQIRELRPGDPAVDKLDKNFKERWFRKILYQSQDRSERKVSKKNLLSINEEDKKICLNLFEEIKGKKLSGELVAYDLSLTFYLLEDYDLALDIIKMIDAPKDSAFIEYLHLDLLYQSGQYINCLDKISCAPMHQENSDIHFSRIYTQALCYWELKKKDLAIDALKTLVDLNPNYRSAHSFLKEWMGELY